MNAFQKYVGNLQILLTPESSGFVLGRVVTSVADWNFKSLISDLIDDENSIVHLSIDVYRYGVRGERKLSGVGVFVENFTSAKKWFIFENPLIRQQIFEEYWDQVESLELNPDE